MFRLTSLSLISLVAISLHFLTTQPVFATISSSTLQNCSLDEGSPLFFYKKIVSKPRDILYSTFAPVIFEFTTPNWTDPINPTAYTCTGDNYDDDGWSCPVLWYWLTQIRDRVQNDIFVENLKIRDESTFLPQNPNSCDQITQLLDGLFLTESAESEFRQSLLSSPCVGSRVVELEKDDTHALSSTEMDAPYRRMREKFFEEYYELQTPTNRTNDAMYTNMRLNIDDAGLSNYYRESQRWKDALRDCSNRKIPAGLISPAKLAQALETVSTIVEPAGLKTAISLNKLSGYYKEPLVDCAFTDDSLVLVLQVPLEEVSASWEEVNLISIPELKTNLNDGGKSICEIKNLDSDKPFLLEQFSQVLQEATEKSCVSSSSRLCQVPEVASIGQWGMMKKTKSCASSIVKGTADMRSVCDYGCVSIDGMEPPMVKRVGADRFIIVGGGGNSESVKVICPDREVEYVTSSDEDGATEVQVPCGCTLISPNYEKVFKVGLPCSNEFSAFEIHSN